MLHSKLPMSISKSDPYGIDVIFSILAFFIISTLFLSRSQSLPVNLPSAQTAEAKQPEQINITMDRLRQVLGATMAIAATKE